LLKLISKINVLFLISGIPPVLISEMNKFSQNILWKY